MDVANACIRDNGYEDDPVLFYGDSKTITVNGLSDNGRAQFKAHAFIVHDRYHDHRNLRNSGSL